MADQRRSPRVAFAASACFGGIPLNNSKIESSEFSARKANSEEFRQDWSLRSISEFHTAGAGIWLLPRPKIAAAPVRPGNFASSSEKGVFQRYCGEEDIGSVPREGRGCARGGHNSIGPQCEDYAFALEFDRRSTMSSNTARASRCSSGDISFRSASSWKWGSLALTGCVLAPRFSCRSTTW